MASSVAAAAAGRAFRVLGVQQVAIGGSDKGALRTLWCGLLGLPTLSSFTSAAENVDEDVCVAGRGVWAVEVDLMAPLVAGGTPNVASPALNHVGLWVDNLPAAVASLQGAGLRFAGGVRKGAAGYDIAFIHPKSAGGVLIELVQAPPAVVAAYDKEAAPPALK